MNWDFFLKLLGYCIRNVQFEVKPITTYLLLGHRCLISNAFLTSVQLSFLYFTPLSLSIYLYLSLSFSLPLLFPLSLSLFLSQSFLVFSYSFKIAHTRALNLCISRKRIFLTEMYTHFNTHAHSLFNTIYSLTLAKQTQFLHSLTHTHTHTHTVSVCDKNAKDLCSSN